MSLDRLIRLAQRTGDRLIVHDRRGEDVVIMSVDEYEYLLDEMVTGGGDGVTFDDEPAWQHVEDVIEDRYHETIPHDHARHDRQYREEDWEEAQRPHQAAPLHAPAQPAAPPTYSHDHVSAAPQPIEYQTPEGAEVEEHQQEQLDEPVFYEEPV